MNQLLVIALNNLGKVQTVDAYGRPIIAPSTPRPPTPPFFWFTALRRGTAFSWLVSVQSLRST